MSDVKEILGNYSSDIIKTIEDELAVITPNNLQEASIWNKHKIYNNHLLLFTEMLLLIQPATIC